MVAFYVIIALCAWYYPGQAEIAFMLKEGSLSEAIAGGGGVEALVPH